jgi:hypothetical protein
MTTSENKIPDEVEEDDLAVVEAYLAAMSLDDFGGYQDPEAEQFPPPGFRWLTLDAREPLPHRDQIEDSTARTEKEE